MYALGALVGEWRASCADGGHLRKDAAHGGVVLFATVVSSLSAVREGPCARRICARLLDVRQVRTRCWSLRRRRVWTARHIRRRPVALHSQGGLLARALIGDEGERTGERTDEGEGEGHRLRVRMRAEGEGDS